MRYVYKLSGANVMSSFFDFLAFPLRISIEIENNQASFMNSDNYI